MAGHGGGTSHNLPFRGGTCRVIVRSCAAVVTSGTIMGGTCARLAIISGVINMGGRPMAGTLDLAASLAAAARTLCTNSAAAGEGGEVPQHKSHACMKCCG